ncbi:vitelline membrane outer layer protein 1 homolog [Engystomops pustulosus]|uniref:vitelline membrane outer layer protein 1 homolog n=1 Tax=Engystomops pustulosus TaxID=76066 RepID=UPI003AFA1542
MFSAVLISLLIQATITTGQWISVGNGGPWGDWGSRQWCPPRTVARGFSLRVERPLGSDGDDTALNAIRLYCASPSTRDTQETITSSESSWGDWTPVSWCPSGHLMSFALQVEPKQGDGDDTAANNIMMQCSDHTVLTGKGGYWGTFSSWSGTCPSGICGIQTRVEGKQGRGDDTALNDVKFGCC